MISLRQQQELQRRQVHASTHSSTRRWPPSSANTAENSAEPTNSQHTIASSSRSGIDSPLPMRCFDLRSRQNHGAAMPANRPPSAPEMTRVMTSPRSVPSEAPMTRPTRLAHRRRFACIFRTRRDTGRRRADAGRFRGGRDAEQDDRQHHQCQDGQRHHRETQHLQDLELLGVQASGSTRRAAAPPRGEPQNRCIEGRPARRVAARSSASPIARRLVRCGRAPRPGAEPGGSAAPPGVPAVRLRSLLQPVGRLLRRRSPRCRWPTTRRAPRRLGAPCCDGS